jgi:predicted transcriptional regulator
LRRSKLETYVDILNLLTHKRPLKLTDIMYKANVNCSLLKENLGFLIKQGLVEERAVGIGSVVFTVTQRGISVLKYFRELTQTLHSIELAQSQKK